MKILTTYDIQREQFWFCVSWHAWQQCETKKRHKQGGTKEIKTKSLKYAIAGLQSFKHCKSRLVRYKHFF